MANSLLPSTSPTAMTGLTLDDLLGSSDVLGLSEDPALAEILGRDPLGLGFAKRKKEPKYQSLPPAEQKSAVKEVLNVGAGGLQLLGDVLDKPGRAVRGALGGNLRELGNLIPFSDTLGITDPEQATSGRQLLEKAGLAGPNTDQGWIPDAGDTAGFALDLALDPLTYLTLGASAVGKAGKVAKAAGISVKGAEKYKTLNQVLQGATPEVLQYADDAAKKAGTTLADLGGEQLGGLFGLTIPGASGTLVPGIAQGPMAQAVGETLGTPLNWLGKSKFGTAVAGAFDHTTQGNFNPIAQQMARAGHAAKEGKEAGILTKLMGFNDELSQLTKDFHDEAGAAFSPGMTADKQLQRSNDLIKQAVQHYAETQGQVGANLDPMADTFGLLAGSTLNPSSAIRSRASDLGMKLKGIQDEAFQLYQKMGGNVESMPETADFGHFFRQTLERAEQAGSGLKSRTKEPKFIPAANVNQMLKDPSLLFSDTGKLPVGNRPPMATVDQIASRLKQSYPDVMANATKAAAGSGKTLDDVANDTAEWLIQKGTRHMAEGKEYYGADVIGNTAKYLKSLNQKNTNFDAMHTFLYQNATGPGEGTVTLAKAYADAGMNPTAAINYLAEKHGINPVEARALRVPANIADAASSFIVKSGSPKWMDAITKVVDPITQFYKKNLTLPFPSFHLRNLVSGHWMNLASNEVNSLRDVLDYSKAWGLARDAIKDPVKHKQLLDELLAYGVIDLKDMDVDILKNGFKGSLPSNTKQVTPIIGQMRTLGSITGEARSIYNEAVAGGSGRIKAGAKAAIGAPMEAGAEAARQIEYSNRATMYAYLRNKGWSPQAAAKRVNDLQIDYSAVTPFEKNVMKRVIPFYTYTRKSVPEVLKNLYERPGGVTAQTVRASNKGRDSDEYIPAYIGEGMSIPTPSGGYLSELGLPTDQFGKLFAQGPTTYGTVRRTLQKLGSNLHPLAKLPIEVMTGTNLFSGKQLTDQYAYPTNSTLMNAVLGNLPTSRLTSVTRTAGDPRKELWEKGVNLLTGARISHPTGGLEAQADRAAKQLLEEILKEDSGIGSFQDVYVKDDAQLSPETERLFRAYRGIINERRKAKKAEKK